MISGRKPPSTTKGKFHIDEILVNKIHIILPRPQLPSALQTRHINFGFLKPIITKTCFKSFKNLNKTYLALLYNVFVCSFFRRLKCQSPPALHLFWLKIVNHSPNQCVLFWFHDADLVRGCARQSHCQQLTWGSTNSRMT